MMLFNVFGSSIAFICLLLTIPAQQQKQPCCAIIDINRDSGRVVIRDFTQGWIKSFQPHVLEFAELKVGDTVDASLSVQQVNLVKGVPKSYPLQPVNYGEPCCEVMNMMPGKSVFSITAKNAAGDSLLFNVPDSVAALMAIGYKVYTSPTHGYAMVLAPFLKDTSYYGFPLLEQVVDKE